jgi:hypothetical protein
MHREADRSRREHSLVPWEERGQRTAKGPPAGHGEMMGLGKGDGANRDVGGWTG